MRKKSSPIVILGPGRCGSTLIQRIINTSDEVIIWGEHDGFLKGLADSYFTVIYGSPINKFHYDKMEHINVDLIKKSYVKHNLSINWINSFGKEKTKEEYRNFIFALLNQNVKIRKKSWGFKEIRYGQKDLVLKMLIDLFPGTKFIFSVRNPFDVILSKMFSFYSAQKRNDAFENKEYDVLKAEMHRFARSTDMSLKSIIHWIENANIDYSIIRFEDLIEDKNKTVTELFKFIGKPMPANAYGPLDVRLENTDKNVHHSEIKAILFEEIPILNTILSDSLKWFNYELPLEH
jgi:hypothetical protein